ncbi:unnamed protein product [Rhodiola kirilowii]
MGGSSERRRATGERRRATSERRQAVRANACDIACSAVRARRLCETAIRASATVPVRRFERTPATIMDSELRCFDVLLDLMQDPLKNGVLMVQTIRNNIMASTVLATTAITLSSLISVYVSSTSNSSNIASKLVYGNKAPITSSVKYMAILLCFLVAFLCNVQSIRLIWSSPSTVHGACRSSFFRLDQTQRVGPRLGNDTIVDGLMKDGLWD